MKNKTKEIIAVGSIALDSIETINGSKNNLIGGSATFFSIAASLQTKVKVVGIVGKDFPVEGWNLFSSKNIDVKNILIEDGETFRWGGKYSDDYSTRETLFTELGVFEDFKPSIHKDDQSTPLVFLGNIQPSLQLAVSKIMRSSEHIVTDTMNLWIDLFPDQLKQVLSISTILLINHEEAEQYTGQNKIDEAANILLSSGPQVVVIKKGSEGAYLAYDKHRITIPVFPIDKVIDPTGAGDTFAGGFMGYLSEVEKPDFVEAVIRGSALASFCVEGFGIEALSKATQNDLKERVKFIKNSIVQEVK
jgi:sugar/nucleoside kinase (ribokinase family)